MDIQKEKWEDSYRNRDNYVFYPHEEVIRFVSRNIRKRIGLNEFKDVASLGQTTKVLDLGCGIGRHIIYCYEMGFEAYGIDLSESAIKVARQWAEQKGMPEPSEKIKQGDIRFIPWPDEYFNYIISHGVLDSMHFDIAREACREVARVLEKGGLFYCDLVSGDDSAHAREFSGEEIVTTKHEEGTIQSYFNFAKINELIRDYFEIEECLLIRNENVLKGNYSSRYHVVLRRI